MSKKVVISIQNIIKSSRNWLQNRTLLTNYNTHYKKFDNIKASNSRKLFTNITPLYIKFTSLNVKESCYFYSKYYKIFKESASKSHTFDIL